MFGSPFEARHYQRQCQGASAPIVLVLEFWLADQAHEDEAFPTYSRGLADDVNGYGIHRDRATRQNDPAPVRTEPHPTELSRENPPYAAVRFLVFLTLPRLSCRAETKSMTLLLAALGGGARRFSPFAFASISFWTSSV